MHFSFLNLKFWWIDLLLGIILFWTTYSIYNKLPLHSKDKKFLIGLRSLTIALFLLAFLQPVFHYVFFKYTKPNLAVFIDNSNSMKVQKQNSSLFSESQNFLYKNLKPLKKHFQIRPFYFSDSLYVNPKSITASGDDSNLTKALQTFFYNFSDDNYNGILLFTDGQFSETENLDSIVNTLKNIGIPVIPIISKRFSFSDTAIQFDPSNPTELKTEQKNTLYFNVKNTTPNKNFKIQFYDNNVLIHSQSIQVNKTKTTIPLSYIPKKIGIHKLKIKIEAKDEFQKNNQDILFIKANKGKYNIGLIYGNLHWDYKFLRRTLSEDQNIKLYSIAKIKKNTFSSVLSSFPLKQMDMLILGNLSQSDVSSKFLSTLARQVKNYGLSLFILGGPNSFLSESIKSQPLNDILPVIPNSKTGKITSPSTIRITEIGKSDPLTLILDDPSLNEKMWQNIPPFEMINGSTPKKGTTLLLVSKQNKKIPIFGYKYSGKGKVVFFSGYPLWTWYFLNVPSHNQQNYTTFIRQLVRDLTSSRLERFNLYTDKFVYKPSEPVKIYAVLLDNQPTKDLKVSVLFNKKKIKVLHLQNSISMKERFTTEWTPADQGEYQLILKTSGKTKKAFFVVGQNQQEFFNIGINQANLNRIARQNDLLPLTKKTITQLNSKLSTKKIKKKFSIQRELWNSFIIVLIIVALLTIEWIYRKNKGYL